MSMWRAIAGLASKGAGRAGGDSAGVLPPGGRSSLEPAGGLDAVMGGLGSFYNGVSPFDPGVLRLLTEMSLHNSIVSQAVRLLVGTVNCGHELVLDGPKRRLARARDLLGDLAPAVYNRSAGVDGLINHYTRQLAVSGVVFSEDVLHPDLSGVREVCILPAARARWKYSDGDWALYQQAGGTAGMVRLNERTTAYYALDCLEGRPPYGVPPFVSIFEAQDLQRDILNNLRMYAKKLGLYGFVGVKVPPPKRNPKETESEYQFRCQNYIQRSAAAYDQAYSKGLVVMPSDHEFEHKDIAKSAVGVDKIVQSVEQLMMSALGIDPAMFGRSFSTTETYAGVVYNLLLRFAAQIQRIIKRRMERTYRLALLLAGLGDVAVSLRWHPQPELDKLKAAQAEGARIDNVLKKAAAGVIDPDQAAQELGYENAVDPEALRDSAATPGAAPFTARLALASDDRGGYLPPRLGRLSAPGDEGGEDEDIRTERRLQAETERLAGEYRAAVTPAADQIRRAALAEVGRLLAASEGMDAEQFASEVHASLVGSYGWGWSEDAARRAIREAVEPVYRSYRQLSDLVGAGRREWTWGGPEQRVLDFAVDADQFYFGKFIDNPEARRRTMRVLRKQWLDHGAGLFGRTDPRAVATFRAELDRELRLLGDAQIQRIADTSVQRLRNWAGVQQLREDGARWAQVWAVLDGRTSEICREMHGRVISVADLADEVDYLSKLGPEQFDRHLRINRPEAAAIRLEGVGSLKAQRSLLPPYHPRCRTRLILSTEPPPDPGNPPADLNEDQQRAWRYWRGLPQAARQQRISESAAAQWGSEDKRRRHAAKHREVASSQEGYLADLDQVLMHPDGMIIRMNQDGRRQLGMVRDKGGADWRLAVVDLDPPQGGSSSPARLRTFYGPKTGRAVSWDTRMKGLSSQGWVEVEP